jgi:hypothetical protein
MLLTALISLSIAHADIAIPPPDGERFVKHDLEVVGLEAHPEVVLIALDGGDTVSGYRAFRPGGEARQTLARGGNNRGGGISAPSVKMLPKAAFEAWEKKSRADVAAQREACASSGEGCAHISRFVPRYPAPKDAVDCGFTMTLVTSGPKRGPDTVVDTIALKTASASTCVVDARPRTAELDGKPVEAGGCSTVGGAVSLGAGLAMLGVAARRRRDGAPAR